MGIIFTSPLPCGPPQFHIAVAPCLAIVEVIYKASPSATQVVGGDILTLPPLRTLGYLNHALVSMKISALVTAATSSDPRIHPAPLEPKAALTRRSKMAIVRGLVKRAAMLLSVGVYRTLTTPRP